MKRLNSPKKFAKVRTRFPRLQTNFGLFAELESPRKPGVPARASLNGWLREMEVLRRAAA
jgi:hypothetical protein